MKIIKEINQDEVLSHWKRTENFSDDDFRSDIRNYLPLDLKWHLAVLESLDIKNIYNFF